MPPIRRNVSRPTTELPFKPTRREIADLFRQEQILLNVDSQILFRLKFVCSQWNTIINELLAVESVNIDHNTENDAVAIFEEFNDVSEQRPEFNSFEVYRSRYRLKYLINDKVISKVLGVKGEVDELINGALLERIYEAAGDVSYLSDPREDRDFDDDREQVQQTAWAAVMAITGMNYPIDELKKT